MESFPLATANREDGIKSQWQLDLEFGLVQPERLLFMELFCTPHILSPGDDLFYVFIPDFHDTVIKTQSVSMVIIQWKLLCKSRP